MRGIGSHVPPLSRQDCPTDNTSVDVHRQVQHWRETGMHVHPEIAREIAAWYQSLGADGMPFAVFQSTGRVQSGFVDAVWRGVRGTDYGDSESLWPLLALLAYIEAVLSV